jgi:hypothetical protein
MVRLKQNKKPRKRIVNSPIPMLEFEMFTAVIMKNAIFWDVTHCGYRENRCFGGTPLLHLQGSSG